MDTPLPEIVAASLGQYLLHQGHGLERIRDMIRDDIRAALDRIDTAHASELAVVMRHFLAAHPEVRRVKV